MDALSAFTAILPPTEEFGSVRLPTESAEGHARDSVRVDFNVPHGGTTGVVEIVYGGYSVETDSKGNPIVQWRILAGADPVSLKPYTSTEYTGRAPVNGNSKLTEAITINIDVTIPRVDPSKPETAIKFVRRVLVPIGPGTTTVPPDPTTVRFGVPGHGS